LKSLPPKTYLPSWRQPDRQTRITSQNVIYKALVTNDIFLL